MFLVIGQVFLGLERVVSAKGQVFYCLRTIVLGLGKVIFGLKTVLFYFRTGFFLS